MTINPSDTLYFVSGPETTPGTTNVSPVFKPFNYIPGTDLSYDLKDLPSDVMTPNRSLASLVKVNGQVGGGLKTHLRRDPVIELLLASGISGTTSNSVCVGGTVESFFTIEKKMLQDGTTPQYYRHKGCSVAKTTISVDSGSNAEVAFDFIGMTREDSMSTYLGASYPAVTGRGNPLTTKDVGTISVGSLSNVVYQNLSLEVGNNREAFFGLGTANATNIGTSGMRDVKLTLSLYQTTLAAEQLFIPDTPFAVNFTFGTGTGNVIRVDLPTCVASMPKQSSKGAGQMIDVVINALSDTTLGSNIKYTFS